MSGTITLSELRVYIQTTAGIDLKGAAIWGNVFLKKHNFSVKNGIINAKV